MKRILFLLAFLTFSVTSLFAQQKVTGKVVDGGNEPVIGAQVRWKETKEATITAVDGTFSIAPSEQTRTLVVSFIGYKTKQLTLSEGQTQVSIKMEDDAQNLDEVVVVGYGLQKKAALTGSVETIKAEDLPHEPNWGRLLTASPADRLPVLPMPGRDWWSASSAGLPP